MSNFSRRTVLGSLGGIMATPLLPPRPARAAPAELTLWGPPAGPSITVIHAIANGLLRDVAEKVTFKSWRSTDELRAGLTSKTMDALILPTQTAANLFNRGLGVRLLNVMTNGLLHLLAGDEGLTTIASLRGRVISVPYRNDTPEVIFRRILIGSGMDPEKDVTLRFAGSPVEATQMLAMGQVDAALLHEPVATAALLAGGKAGPGRPLFRVIDIQRAWATATGLPPLVPQAGLGITDWFAAGNRDTVEALQAGLARAAASVVANPRQAAEEASAEFRTPAPVIASSIPHANLTAQRASEARPVLEGIYRAVAEFDAKIIGGKLPSADFYL
jgi:NitT/TauT family transport system substrate-binding protein